MRGPWFDSQLLEHDRHDRWLGGGADRDPVLELGGNRIVAVDLVQRQLGEEAMAVDFGEGPGHLLATDQASTAELGDQLPVEPQSLLITTGSGPAPVDRR